MSVSSWTSRLLAVTVAFAATAPALTALTACGNSSGSAFTSDAGKNPDGSPITTSGDSAPGADVVTILPPPEGGANVGTLTLAPAVATLAVTDATALPSQAFTATLANGTTHKAVDVVWSLSDFSVGGISATGTFTPLGTVAGTVNVLATYGTLTASAKAIVTINVSSQLANVTLPDGTVITEDANAISPANLAALKGTPKIEDAGVPTTILYPYDQTVFPLGLLAPVVQFTPGSVAPVDFKLSLDTTGFHWDGFGHVGNPATLQGAIPQTIWDGALQTAASKTPSAQVTLSVVKAANGIAYGPAAESHLLVANGKLTGVIYFESYSSDPIDGGAALPGDTDFGLWAVKPGLTAPPAHLQPGCVICHGVSASGNTLTNGTDDPTVGGSTGVFRVEADGGYTHLATAPPVLPYVGGGGIDSRGLGWGTISPDGKVILRGINQFWGGDALLAWATPNEPLLEGGVVQPLSTSMTVNGNFNMFVPEFSEDGHHIVFVTAANGPDAGSPGTESQSIGMLDVTMSVSDGGGPSGFGTVTLENPRLLYDSTKVDGGGAGAFTKVPTFLPDSKSVVFEETHQSYDGYNHMLPDYLGQAQPTDPGVDGELAMLQPNGSGGYVRVALQNANRGVDPAAPEVNYEPKPLPVQVGGYYWVVFSSRRLDAYPNLAAPKKLWVTAISPGGTVGADPSHPPFTLVNQAITAPQASQRAYWSLAPCLGLGASCQTGNDCCNGSCIPKSSTDPTSPLVCRAPTANTCVALGGRCAAGQSQDCCNSSSGVACIGTLNGYGTCSQPGPPP